MEGELHPTQINSEVVKGLFLGQAPDALVPLLESILNQFLQAMATEAVGATKYERTDERKAYRNGSRERTLKTRIGTITLDVPRLRNGEFSHELLERYQRAEQALVLTMMEMVLQGVSTRKVTQITEELCGTSFSKSTVSKLCQGLDEAVQAFRNRPLQKHYPFIMVDAMYVKVREGGRVQSKAFLIAIGVDEEGYREVLECLASSLCRCDLAAMSGPFHPKHHGSLSLEDQASAQGRFAGTLGSKDQDVARERLQHILATYDEKAPKSMKTLEEGFDDATSVLNLPPKYRRRLRTINTLERLNQELRRRERVIRIFPNQESVIRLLGALLCEQSERWLSGRKWLDMAEYFQQGTRSEQPSDGKKVA